MYYTDKIKKTHWNGVFFYLIRRSESAIKLWNSNERFLFYLPRNSSFSQQPYIEHSALYQALFQKLVNKTDIVSWSHGAQSVAGRKEMGKQNTAATYLEQRSSKSSGIVKGPVATPDLASWNPSKSWVCAVQKWGQDDNICHRFP